MRHAPAAPVSAPAVDRALRGWLLLGLLALLLIPAARGHHPWIGWLPFWLLVWPAISLALLHRARLRVRLRKPLPRARRARRQARRQLAKPPRRRLLLAALRPG